MRVSRVVAAAVVATVMTGAPRQAGAAGSTMWGSTHMLSLMDTNKNGVVSREEYSQFVGRTDRTGRGFRYLDINRNGKLENNELRRINAPDWMEHIGVNHPSKK